MKYLTVKLLAGKVLAAILFTLFSLSINAQNVNYSPYSRFGAGQYNISRNVLSASMGGTAIGMYGNTLVNSLNPASYSAIDTLSFIFDAAMGTRLCNISTESNSVLYSNTNVLYFAAGLPVTRWWKAAFGLQPYSFTGYNLQSSQTLNDSITAVHTYTGEGGLNRFYLGHAFQIVKNLSVGINTSFIFGSLDRKTRSVFTGLTYASEYRNTQRVIIEDFHFDAGIQYHFSLKNNRRLTAGLVFENKTAMKTKVSDFTLKYLNIAGVLSLDTLINTTRSNQTIDFPLHAGLGLSYSSPDVFLVTADFRFFKRDNNMFLGVNDSLSNSILFCTGVQYIPQYNSPNKYWKRIAYRAGAQYYTTGLEMKGIPVNQIGISFGLGLPLRRTKTMINIAVEAGTMGSHKNGLIREQYVNVSAGLLLHDRWFIKPKYE